MRASRTRQTSTTLRSATRIVATILLSAAGGIGGAVTTHAVRSRPRAVCHSPAEDSVPVDCADVDGAWIPRYHCTRVPGRPSCLEADQGTHEVPPLGRSPA